MFFDCYCVKLQIEADSKKRRSQILVNVVIKLGLNVKSVFLSLCLQLSQTGKKNPASDLHFHVWNIFADLSS